MAADMDISTGISEPWYLQHCQICFTCLYTPPGYTSLYMIYKTKSFQSVLKKTGITDDILVAACIEMENGLVDADLGEHLYKKRVPIPGKGKSGGYRTMIGAVIGEKYFFLYMFAKSDRSNINKQEKMALKELAKEFVGFNQEIIDRLVETGDLIIVEQSV